MKLYGYTCPFCETYHRNLRGVVILGAGVQIRCGNCHNVETIESPHVQRRYGRAVAK